MKLEHKVILITGASQGIGRTLALGMAKEGADIVVNYHSSSHEAENVVREIKALDRKAIAIQADVSNVSDIQTMFRQVKNHFGRLDASINNAGITGWTDFFEITEAQYDHVMDTNLKGSFFCALEAAKLMREQKSGVIINISTNCAELGVKNLDVYASSKGGIHAMTKQLAVTLAPYNIRVNTFAPGPTNVERNLRDDPNYRETWGKMTPMQRTAEVEEMLGPAVFLASDDSSYMTGQIFFVDGGWTVWGRVPEEHMDAVLEKRKE